MANLFQCKRSYLYDIGFNDYLLRVWPDAIKAFQIVFIFGIVSILPFQVAEQIATKAVFESMALIGLTFLLFVSISVSGLGLTLCSRKTSAIGKFVLQVARYFSELTFTVISFLIGVVIALALLSTMRGDGYFSSMIVVLITTIAMHVLLIFMTRLINGPIKYKAFGVAHLIGLVLFVGGLFSIGYFPWWKY